MSSGFKRQFLLFNRNGFIRSGRQQDRGDVHRVVAHECLAEGVAEPIAENIYLHVI